MPLLRFFALAVCLLSHSIWAQEGKFTTEPLPALPTEVDAIAVGAHGEVPILMTGGVSYSLDTALSQWVEAGSSETFVHPLAVAASDTGMYVVLPVGPETTGNQVARVTVNPSNTTQLTELPKVMTYATALVLNDILHVTDGREIWVLDTEEPTKGWAQFQHSLPGPVTRPMLSQVQGRLYIFGLDAEAGGVGYRFDEAGDAWQAITGPPQWSEAPAAVPYGLSHVFFFLEPEEGAVDVAPSVIGYHAVLDRYADYGLLDKSVVGPLSATRFGDDTLVVHTGGALLFTPSQVQTNYSWIDNSVIGLYLVGMVGIGWFFARRESSTNDYFRGGQRIPWWAAGMSLFATGASAISLAGMPGMGFGTDWTYFVITIMFVLCLPVAIFIMAPLVRRLKISTSNEYLELRFGLTSRLFASTVWIIAQVAARIASVMLLSAIALEAITDMNIATAIIIMGVVTTVYTYLGGLEAVIWTDTVQGFVMVFTVLGCLILAIVSLDATPAQLWGELQAYDKVRMFDWEVGTWARATTLIFFLHVFCLSFIGISDQNFVQRVQSTPSLKQTKLAVAAQLAVAVPVNILLFSLGTALWLFYRAQPESLSPTMVNNDAVFPFFAAQQLPTGISGIVVAALLAATMSTVSSGICSVSDLCTNDFYCRFKRNPTDRQVLVLGRTITAIVGVFGTVAAIALSQIDGLKSVWDLATMVTGLISSGIIGLFMLGLITRRTHELGALTGTAVGMLTVVYLQVYTDVIFWLFVVVGTLVTIAVGLVASLVLPGKPKATDGLTFSSLSVESSDLPATSTGAT